MAETSKTVMTVEEMGAALHLSKAKAYELIHSQFSPPVIRIGRVFRVPVEGFNAWLAEYSGKGVTI